MASTPSGAIAPLIRVDFRERKKGEIVKDAGVISRIFPIREAGRKLRYEVRYYEGARLKRKKFSDQPGPNGKSARTLAREFASKANLATAERKAVSSTITARDEEFLIWLEERGAKYGRLTGDGRPRSALLDELFTQAELAHSHGIRIADAIAEAVVRRGSIDRTVAQVVDELLADVKARSLAQGSSLHHWRALSVRLAAFRTHFTGPIRSITNTAVERWINSLGLGSKTWNHYRGAVVQLARFAYARKYLSRDAVDELAAIKAHKIRKGNPNPYTPAELRSILEHVRAHEPEFLGFLLCVAFCGYRVEEVISREKRKADWADIDLEGEGLKILATQCKVGGERFTALPANAKAWFRLVHRPAGQICEWIKPDQKLRKICTALGIKVRPNGLRHAFISHRVSQTNDIAKVADEAGTSVSKIRKQYLKLVSKRQAEAYFGIWPTEAAQLTLC